MAFKFKYNKSALYELSQQLVARQRALPTLKSKEAALRLEIRTVKANALQLQAQLHQRLHEVRNLARLWVEFEEGLVKIKDASYQSRTIAGVKIPVLKALDFEVAEISQYHKPDWFLDGIHILEDLAKLRLLYDVAARATAILEYARKKTTQKVNLYEKVQIPEYQEAIRKIKRFLEDEENLAKASQKILKKRYQKAVSV